MADERVVTEGELDRTLGFLAEIRKAIRDEQEDQKELYRQLLRQMTDGFKQVTDRQDIANGKLMKHESSIKRVTDDMLDLHESVGKLMEEGCQQKAKHVAELNALATAGVIDSEESVVNSRTKDLWQRHKRTIGIAGGSLTMGAIFEAIGPDVMRNLIKLIHALLEMAVK